jgi:FAD synthetase
MGHIYYLKEAKKLGDQLIVVVACDDTVLKLKHEPITSEQLRLGLIKELKVVDEAYLGGKNDMYAIVEELKPDIIALGFDQIHDIKQLEKELIKRKLKAKIIRLSKFKDINDLNGTRRIITKIIDAYKFQKEMEAIEKHEKNRSC